MLFDGAGAVNLAPETRRCGYIFQDGRLFPHLRVRANLTYGEALTPSPYRLFCLSPLLYFLFFAHLLYLLPAPFSGFDSLLVPFCLPLLSSPLFLFFSLPLSSLSLSFLPSFLLSLFLFSFSFFFF